MSNQFNTVNKTMTGTDQERQLVVQVVEKRRCFQRRNLELMLELPLNTDAQFHH